MPKKIVSEILFFQFFFSFENELTFGGVRFSQLLLVVVKEIAPHLADFSKNIEKKSQKSMNVLLMFLLTTPK